MGSASWLAVPVRPVSKGEQQTIDRLRELVYMRCGMYFPVHRRWVLENRCRRRMRSLSLASLSEYRRMLADPGEENLELHRLLDELTVRETSFFRGKRQFQALQHVFLPEIVERKTRLGQREIRIWSVGCRSGEEPYSIAIAVLEARPGLPEDWKVQILATDRDERALEAARAGVYTRSAFRTLPRSVLDLYFASHGHGRYRVVDAVREMVRFHRLDLSDETTGVPASGFDVIFCRNVLIYLDPEDRKRMIHRLHEALVDWGLLFIGVSETLFGSNDCFQLVQYPGGTAYRKATPRTEP